MNDPLAQFRKKPIERRGDVTTAEPEGYVAFATKDRVERVKIRRANAPTRSPRYHDLWDVTYDGEFGTNFVAVFAFSMVLVSGRNLQPIVAALQQGTCDFLQEFDPERWVKPKDEAAPFIELMEVAIPEGAPSVGEADDVSVPGGGRPH